MGSRRVPLRIELAAAVLLCLGGELRAIESAPDCAVTVAAYGIAGIDFSRTTRRRPLYQKSSVWGSGSYEDALGSRFVERLRALTAERGADAHWIDLGAGEGGALRQYLMSWNQEGWFPDPARRMRVTGVEMAEGRPEWHRESFDTAGRGSVQIPRTGIRPVPYFERNARWFEGRRLDDPAVDLTGVGRGQIVTDLYGPLSYAERPDIALGKALGVLAEDGVLYVRVRSDQTTITTPDGPLSFDRWLDTIPGIRVTPHGARGEEANLLEITLVPGTPVRIPRLRLTDYIQGGPPVRTLVQEP